MALPKIRKAAGFLLWKLLKKDRRSKDGAKPGPNKIDIEPGGSSFTQVKTYGTKDGRFETDKRKGKT